jgi:hypothetical protein
MFALLSPLAYDREQLMVAALAALCVAGAVVAVGAWLLFFRDRLRTAKARDEEDGRTGQLAQVTGEAKSEEPEP